MSTNQTMILIFLAAMFVCYCYGESKALNFPYHERVIPHAPQPRKKLINNNPGAQIYFTVTIAMVTIFGVAEGEPEPVGISDPQSTANSNQAEDPLTLRILNICVVTLSSLGLVSTFLLFYGLAKNLRPFLLPWITIVTCTTAVDLIYAVYLLIHVESLNPISAMVFTGDFVLVVVNVYCILCVVSQYQELNKNRPSAQGIVGLAVTEDLFDTNQPPLEEIKLSEVIGPDQRIHCCQQLDAICGDGLWLDCHHHHLRLPSQATDSAIRIDTDDDNELPSNSQRRVTFKCRAAVGS